MEWHLGDQKISGYDYDQDIDWAAAHGDRLAFGSGWKTYLYDTGDPSWRLIETIETLFHPSAIKFDDDRLVIGGEPWMGQKPGGVRLVEPKDGTTLFERELDLENFGLGLRGNHIFIAHDKGIAHLDVSTSELTESVGFVPDRNDPTKQHGMYDSYGKDLVVGEEHVFVNGRHVGVNAFHRGDNESLEFLKKVGPTYTPTQMEWLERDQSLLLLGDTHVLAFDVQKPAKPKKLASISFKKSEVECGVRDGDLLYVLVRPIFKETRLILATIELGPAPALVNEQTFDCEDRASPRALVKNGDQLRALFFRNAPMVFGK